MRKSGKPVDLLANKSEGRAGEAGALEAYALGLGEPVAISAEHGEGLADLYDALRELAAGCVPDDRRMSRQQETDADAARPIRVAVVGRPNAGKSTLINRLLGEDRLLTGPEAGITRDTIAVASQWQGHRFSCTTPRACGERARSTRSWKSSSVADALKAIRFAEVVVLLMDAARAVRGAGSADRRSGRARGPRARHRHEQMGSVKADRPAPSASCARRPITGCRRSRACRWSRVSGLTGEGLDRLMQAVVDAYAVWNRRVPTAALNRWFEDAISAHPPPAVSGRRLRLNYITQAKARPPSFVHVLHARRRRAGSLQRYLVNALREAFDLPGTPIRLTLREKENPYAERK